MYRRHVSRCRGQGSSLRGNYYAWGETQAKSEYTPENYKFYKKGSWRYALTKYCSNPKGGYKDFVDNKMTLDTDDDAARAVRGKEWRMPTPKEIEELVNNCTWSYTYDYKEYVGYKVTAKTSYSIFLPTTGYKDGNVRKRTDFGYYLTNSKMNNVEYGDFPMLKVFYFSSQGNPNLTDDFYETAFHHKGYCIRPVHP